MALISLENVSIDFPIHNADSRSFQLRVLGALGGKIDEHKRAVIVRALKNVTLQFEDGDRIGIVGHNGAGKTTLLRVLAGVYEPTSGTVKIDGRISSFTDIALGMDPEATGLENIIFRCVFMGLSFKAAHQLSPSIEEFSELGEYLRLPVRTYSTGMFVRLAFAISTAIDSDIIIMDEMIGAADARFVAKAQQRLSEILQRAKIMVVASHDPGIIKSLCSKVVWLHHGEVQNVGGFDEVYPMYLTAKV